MKNEIIKNLEKAYIAVSHADCLNGSRFTSTKDDHDAQVWISNTLYTIKELLKECKEALNESTN